MVGFGTFSSRFRVSLFVITLLSSSGLTEPRTSIDLGENHGKVVVVDFWASWCVPCRRSFPWLNDIVDRYENRGLVVFGINLDADRDEAEKFLKEYPVSFDIVFDPSGDLAREFDVVAMPSSYVYGRDGRLIARHLGFKVKKADAYEKVIVDALLEPE